MILISEIKYKRSFAIVILRRPKRTILKRLKKATNPKSMEVKDIKGVKVNKYFFTMFDSLICEGKLSR